MDSHLNPGARPQKPSVIFAQIREDPNLSQIRDAVEFNVAVESLLLRNIARQDNPIDRRGDFDITRNLLRPSQFLDLRIAHPQGPQLLLVDAQIGVAALGGILGIAPGASDALDAGQ